ELGTERTHGHQVGRAVRTDSRPQRRLLGEAGSLVGAEPRRRLEPQDGRRLVRPEALAMRHRCRWPMAIVVVCLLGECRAAAQGGPPYYTNDPITPGPSRWEINVGYIPLLATDQSTRRMPDVDINYGAGERIQLTLELGWLGVQTV